MKTELTTLKLNWVVYEELGYWWDFNKKEKTDLKTGLVTKNISVEDFIVYIQGKK